MKEMNYAEMQNVNGGGGIGIAVILIALGLAIYVGAKALPKWVEKQVAEYKKKYNIK